MQLSIPAKVFAAFLALLLCFGGVMSYTVWRVSLLGEQVALLQESLMPLSPIVAQIRGELLGLKLALDAPDPASLRRNVHLARRVHPYLEGIGQGFLQVQDHLDVSGLEEL